MAATLITVLGTVKYKGKSSYGRFVCLITQLCVVPVAKIRWPSGNVMSYFALAQERDKGCLVRNKFRGYPDLAYRLEADALSFVG